MECSEVQKRLSAYLEKVVSSRQKALIDGHLKKCKKCRRSLADLKKAVEYVQKLEEVEPPAWLAQKVMAQVRAEAEAKRGIWQRLFRPFHIKLPLEAIALIFVAVGAFYIFKAVQPAMRLAKIPTEMREQAPSPVTAFKKEKPPAVNKGQPAPAKAREELLKEKKVETREERRSAATPQTPAAPAKQEGGGYTDHAQVSRDVASLQEVRPKAAGEMKAPGLRFVVTVGEIETARKDIEGIMRQLGGKAITVEPYEGKAVIAAELDAKKVQELTRQLDLIGEVQGKELTVEEREGAVQVTVEIEKSSYKP
jgi:hypothetical protein